MTIKVFLGQLWLMWTLFRRSASVSLSWIRMTKGQNISTRKDNNSSVWTDGMQLWIFVIFKMTFQLSVQPWELFQAVTLKFLGEIKADTLIRSRLCSIKLQRRWSVFRKLHFKPFYCLNTSQLPLGNIKKKILSGEFSKQRNKQLQSDWKCVLRHSSRHLAFPTSQNCCKLSWVSSWIN